MYPPPEDKRVILRVAATALLTCGIAGAQAKPAPIPTKPLAFEVVSIRPTKPGNAVVSSAITPDGYRTHGMSMYTILMEAYFPEGMSTWSGRLSGTEPNWFLSIPYDLEARVSEQDRPAWQNQKKTITGNFSLKEQPMLREMLQTMLAERCKLTLHRVPGQLNGYALVARKGGPKLTPSKPDATLPYGVKLPDGGIGVGSNRGQALQWSYHSVSMAGLVDQLKTFSQFPVLDHTGLDGRFDFVLRCAAFDPDHPDSGCQGAPEDRLLQWDLRSLGLRLEPIKIPIDTIVIDHIEKPSEN